MDLSEAVVTCAVNMEWRNATGVTGRKLTYRAATLRLIRNEIREVFVEISTEKTKPIKLKLKDVMIHKKFMAEGKASITFKSERCTMLLSNAPPGTLIVFLRTMFIKLSGNENLNEAELKNKLRVHLLSGKPSKFEEISPVTSVDMIMARKAAGISKATTTTPSPPQAKKRRFDELKNSNSKSGISQLPAAKKLYQSSPLADCDNLQLCDEQKEVLQTCVNGKSIFFTGSAGTGKSFLLRKIISALPPDTTIATASTGVAACLIGGVTLHSFAGIGGGDAGLSRCIDMASKSTAAQNWRKCKTLIIDEISMVDGQYFDKVETVARHLKRNDRPFGGIQLILCGDFLQLPPVVKVSSGSSSQQTDKRFCFQSAAWETCIQVVYELKQVHRQSDPEFVKILNHIRIGHVNDEITQRLRLTSKQKIEGNGILASQLCSHTNDADSINNIKLENLTTEKFLFNAEDSDPTMRKQLDLQVQAPYKLELKIGAQVMLLKNINISSGLVNGARGVVCKFDKNLPIVRFKNNQEYLCKTEKWIIKTPTGGLITRKQIPLKLAWAFSIHKSQGLTLDCVEMSLSKVFEAGQAYVALSRAKSLDSIRILDFDGKQVWANPQVLQYYKIFRRRLHDMTMIPLGEKRINIKKERNQSALDKIRNSILNKPLVSIG